MPDQHKVIEGKHQDLQIFLKYDWYTTRHILCLSSSVDLVSLWCRISC